MSASEFVEAIVGVGASRVRDLFKKARDAAPAIIFIDELDAIGRSRQGTIRLGGNDEQEQTLTEMDGFDSREGVIVQAATNRADVLDAALATEKLPTARPRAATAATSPASAQLRCLALRELCCSKILMRSACNSATRNPPRAVLGDIHTGPEGSAPGWRRWRPQGRPPTSEMMPHDRPPRPRFGKTPPRCVLTTHFRGNDRN